MNRVLTCSSFTFIMVLSVFLVACNQSIFSSKTYPHQQYRQGIVQAGLQGSQLGRQWITAAERSLQQPVSINLPYKETGYFAMDKPRAIAYLFTLRRGDKVSISLVTNPATGSRIFSDLWQPGKITGNDKPLAVIDSVSNKMQYAAGSDGSFIVRIQPELLAGMEYTLTIVTQPTLAYPVQQSGKPRIISYWGAGRDNGSRKHEGIDIGAAFRTPALAVADGYVTQVNENKLGGKVVFMRPSGADFSVYYAHLDSQVVRSGQTVNAGDVVGLVGNTGNAANTPPHLHFGIYTSSGAIDPLAFVEQDRKQPANVTASKDNFNKWVRVSKNAVVHPSPASGGSGGQVKAGDALFVEAAIDNRYRVRLPNDSMGFINEGLVSATMLRRQKITTDKKLQDAPHPDAPMISQVPSGSEVEVKGTYNGFLRVKYREQEGWLLIN